MNKEKKCLNHRCTIPFTNVAEEKKIGLLTEYNVRAHLDFCVSFFLENKV